MDNFFSCGKSGHKMRDCQNLKSQDKCSGQAQASGSSDSPKKNRFYALRSRGEQATSPDVVIVSSPEGESVVAKRLYQNCPISLPNRVSYVDLVELDMLDFDIILGMDWLHACFASIDCRKKMGCHYHIVRVKDLDSKIPPIESVPVVNEFLEIFPNDLPVIPPEREIDFLLETNPVSIPLYRIAQTESKELKAQLMNLLEKGLISPGIYPWGAPVLFVKKKVGL
ncbi:uncharacterized protein [Solanum lycopersicum]|uniref:uncharacterized protein n=1 Tax=Solanum lycopersicum TaxID=4081 RepID=UPI00374A2A69